MTEADPGDLEGGRAGALDARPLGRFHSILFPGSDVADWATTGEPPFFADLHLDEIVASVLAGSDEQDLKPLFSAPLRDLDTIEYRHEIFRDLERAEVMAALREFTTGMERVRRHLALAEKQHYRYERERWFLDAATIYCAVVPALLERLDSLAGLESRGLCALRAHLADYVGSDDFASLAHEATHVLEGLGRVHYTLRIRGLRVTVSAYDGESDYGAEIEELFARFRRGEAEDHLVEITDSGSMDHVEARIAELVARLYPREFDALETFCIRYRDFVDRSLARFDREIRFYLRWLEHVDRLRAAALPFCYPLMSARPGEVSVEGAFDLALASKLTAVHQPVVENSFTLRAPERILVVTGPNQGGKTTFARMVGQLHHLAALGVPVPGRHARLGLTDRVFTHFEREEDVGTLHGKLDHELLHLREILEQATEESVVILNEAFSSTTLADAAYIGTRVLEQLTALGCLTVLVTFVDELASLNDATVSMVATVPADDPTKRTFQVVRRPADGRAYAWALADRYGLSYEKLRERIQR
jgi:hypothetical protein